MTSVSHAHLLRQRDLPQLRYRPPVKLAASLSHSQRILGQPVLTLYVQDIHQNVNCSMSWSVFEAWASRTGGGCLDHSALVAVEVRYIQQQHQHADLLDCHHYRLLGLVVKASAPRQKIRGLNPPFSGIFPGRVIAVIYKLAPMWLPCRAPGVIGSVLGLVGPVSVYCDRVRWGV